MTYDMSDFVLIDGETKRRDATGAVISVICFLESARFREINSSRGSFFTLVAFAELIKASIFGGASLSKRIRRFPIISRL